MLKPLRYFFMRTFQWKSRSESPPLAVFTALGLTTVVVYMNAYAIELLFSWLLGGGPLTSLSRSQYRALGAIIGITIFIIFYRLWISSGAYLRFPEEFVETEEQRHRRGYFVLAYGVVSFILPFALMIMTIKRDG